MNQPPLTLVFDERCGLCTAWVKWVKKQDKEHIISFIPCNSTDRERLIPAISLDECRREFKLLLPDGTILGGGAAIPELLKHLPRWKPLGKFLALRLNRPLLNWGYRTLAQNRFFLSRVLGKEWHS